MHTAKILARRLKFDGASQIRHYKKSYCQYTAHNGIVARNLSSKIAIGNYARSPSRNEQRRKKKREGTGKENRHDAKAENMARRRATRPYLSRIFSRPSIALFMIFEITNGGFRHAFAAPRVPVKALFIRGRSILHSTTNGKALQSGALLFGV